MESLYASLEQYHMNTLLQIASYIGEEVAQPRPRKAWLVDQLAHAIPEHAADSSTIAALSDAARAVLALLLQSTGQAPVSELFFPLAISGLIAPISSRASSSNLPSLEQVVASLLYRGLVVNLTQPLDASRRTLATARTIAISPEVQKVLPRELLELPEPRAIGTLDTPPAQILAYDTDMFLRQLFFFWAELRRKPAQRLKSGDIGKRDLRRVAQSMGLSLDEEEDRLRRLYAFLETLNLVSKRGPTIDSVDEPAALRFWNTNPATLLQRILKIYPEIDTDSPVVLEPLYKQGYHYNYLTARNITASRKKVLEMLVKLPQEKWISFPYFVAFLNQGQAGHFLLAGSVSDSLIMHSNSFSRKYQSQIEGALVDAENQTIASILEQFSRLGVVNLGYDKGTLPSALQVTALGRAALTDQTYISDRQAGQVVLQPDFQVLAMGPVPLGQLAALERFADREKVDEGVVAYRITRDSVYPALQSGDTVGTIMAFLQRITDQPIPQNVERTLEEWSERHERIVVRRDVCILQVDSPDKLQQFLEDQQIGKYLHRIDPRAAWIRSSHAKKIEQRMQEMALLPTVSKGPEEDLPNSMTWDDGALLARHPILSLYVEGTLRRFAQAAEEAKEEAEADGQGEAASFAARKWHLTPKSVRAAVQKGMEAPELIALLEMLTGKKLSTAWEKRIKAWGSHYGEGRLAHVTLLRLESAEALQDLRDSDPHLRHWLLPLPENKDGLAIVDEAHLEEVLVTLEEWGVELEEKHWW